MTESSIQISLSLINRLLTDESKLKKKTKNPKPKASREPKQLNSKPKPDSSMQMDNQIERRPLQSPVDFPLTPTQTSLPIVAAVDGELLAIHLVLQDSEKVKNKLEKLEANMTKELTGRAKELREKEFKLPFLNTVHCAAEREACLNCYKEHSNSPLKCAEMVKSFFVCARQATLDISN